LTPPTPALESAVDPTSVVLAVLVVTLLLPGLVMMVAVVVRYLLRGSKEASGEESAAGGARAFPIAPPRERAGVRGERKDY
jgi:hypothetical protein